MNGRYDLWVGTGLLLFACWTGGAAAVPVLPPLQEEAVNPSEVIFRRGTAFIDLGHGRLEPLHVRRKGGEVLYYRLVRYDAEFGYVKEPEPEVEFVYTSRPRSSTVAESHDIESRIDGDFEGWAGNTLFRLQNGQIWQQTDGRVRRATAISPRVTLTRRGFDYEMKVDGVSETIRVRRR